MNTEMLIERIGSLDDELIDFYFEYQKPQLSKAKIAAAAVAACLVLTAGVMAAVNFNGRDMQIAVDSESSEQINGLTESSSAPLDSDNSKQNSVLDESSFVPAESVVSSAVENSSSSTSEKTGNVIISDALQEAMDNAESEDEVFEIRIVQSPGDFGNQNFSVTPDDEGIVRATVKEIKKMAAEEGSSARIMLADENDRQGENYTEDYIYVDEDYISKMGDEEVEVQVNLKDGSIREELNEVIREIDSLEGQLSVDELKQLRLSKYNAIYKKAQEEFIRELNIDESKIINQELYGKIKLYADKATLKKIYDYKEGKGIIVYLDSVNNHNFQGTNSITDDLKRKLRVAENDELISVTIELKDSIDLKQIEEQAMKNAGITSEELAAAEAGGYALDDEANISYQQEIGKLYDRISTEKIKLLNEYYMKLNNGFMELAGLTEKEYSSISTLTPFISNIKLSKAEILRISEMDEVGFLWYNGEEEGYDFGNCYDFGN